MLARGVLCRLAVHVPKQSAHDLSRLSQLLRQRLSARNGASYSTVGVIARPFQAGVLRSGRAYATKSATQPTARVKRDVKKAAAEKPKKKPAAKATTTKKAAKRTKAKKKPAAPKKKPVKKVLTAEQQEAAKVKALKEKALKPPTRTSVSAWTVFASEALKGGKSLQDQQGAMQDAAAKFKTLTAAEREHYNHLAREQSEQILAEYNKWIHQHTTAEIHSANLARAALRRKLKIKGTRSQRYQRLVDDRVPRTTRSRSPWIRFFVERMHSGDFKGIQVQESSKLIANEWKALSDGEKKKYRDDFAAIA